MDPDYVDLMDLEIIEGRNFSWDLETDKRQACILNETAAKVIGWKKPIGQIVNRDSSDVYNYFFGQKIKVIGIVKDFHFESLHVPIVPLAYAWDEKTHGFCSIKISAHNITETLNNIEETWLKYSPEYPFKYSFLDKSFDQMYKTEQRLGIIAIYFSILAVFIACLGLFGLSAFMVERRIKEIGIRKVLGASIIDIVKMLSGEYTRLVLYANIIAIPVTWYVLHLWLQDYPYSTTIHWWIFIISALITIIIALFTVSFQSIKAAVTNPAETVKYE